MVSPACIGAVTARGGRSLIPPGSPERNAPRSPARQSTSGPAGTPRSGPGVYLLLGEETWLADETLAKLLRELLPASERDLNLDVLDTGETPVQDIIAKCDTLPFFGTCRVVVLRLRDERDIRPGGPEMLAAYLEQGPPPSTLIVVAEKLDRRRRLFTVLQRIARIIPCRQMDPEELPRWVRARVAAAGKTIVPQAAEALVMLAGGNLRELASEIDKLVAYVGARRAIAPADVHEVTSHVAAATVFDLMDAVGLRQTERALRLLQVVLTGESPVRVLFMLSDQIRMLLRTKALDDRRRPTRRPSREEIRQALGTRAFLYDRYRAQVAAFGRFDIGRVLGLLLEADAEIKTGAKPPRLALETLVVGLCV
jgi:DNA polymerase III subunit delta